MNVQAMSTSHDDVLSLRGMTKVLQAEASRFELRIDDLTLKHGKFYGLMGKSGSGKSTLLDLLAMVSKPTRVTEFSVVVNKKVFDLAALLETDHDSAISRVRLTNFGYVLQSGGLFSFLSVRENLELPFRLSGMSVDREWIMRLVKNYDMESHLDKKPSGLSGGQRQRVSILRALSLRPQIVLADEPTASVDENMADTIVKDLKTLAVQQNTAVFMVSHDLDLLNKVSDHVFSLKAMTIGPNSTLSELHKDAQQR